MTIEGQELKKSEVIPFAELKQKKKSKNKSPAVPATQYTATKLTLEAGRGRKEKNNLTRTASIAEPTDVNKVFGTLTEPSENETSEKDYREQMECYFVHIFRTHDESIHICIKGGCVIVKNKEEADRKAVEIIENLKLNNVKYYTEFLCWGWI